MQADKIVALRAAVIAASTKRSTFVEFLDDDQTQYVVTDIIERKGEMVAVLACGDFVTLSDDDVEASDFRVVSPAIPPECPGRDCERCPLQPVCPDWAPPDAKPNYFHGVLAGSDTLPGYERKPLPTADAQQ